MTPRIFVLFAVLCFGYSAQAQVTASFTGSGCIPSDATINAGRHRVTNGAVQHAPDEVGLITLTCPITPFANDSGTWGLNLIARDSTGGGPSAHVRARLYRMSIIADPPTGTPVLLAAASSDDLPFTTINTAETIFDHNFRFSNHIYWILIDLDRTTTSQTVVFHGVYLQNNSGSDIRLKHGIALLGRLANGLGFYRFSYNGSDKAYVGVMAQEVEAIRPDAVVRGSDGYLRVAYGRLGLRMQTWDEWVASGGKIREIAALR